MAIKKRLDLIVKELGLSGRAFEKECGLANGSYSSIGDGVGADKLNKILFRYPQFSADWVISGKGEMLKKIGNPDDVKNAGSNFEGNNGEQHPIHPLNREDMKFLLNQMAGIVGRQQQEISKLIAELEQNGKRSDRILKILESQLLMENYPEKEQMVGKYTSSDGYAPIAEC